MNFENIENEIILNYCSTLKRINLKKLPKNNYLKNPYLDQFILNLSNLKDKELETKIDDDLKENEILNDDMLNLTLNIVEFNEVEKKKILKFFMNENYFNENYLDLSKKIILFQVYYFQFFNISSELLFNNEIENDELYHIILLYVKNVKKEISQYKKNNINLLIFNYFYNKLLKIYEEIYILLKNNYILEKTYDKSEIYNFLLKNLFSNWYKIYKKDLENDDVNEKIKKFKKINFISKILCLPNA